MNNEKVANDILKHYGVMGMKWGVRKDQPSGQEILTTRKLKNGGSLVITKDPTPPIAKLLTSLSPTYKKKNSSYTTRLL